MPTVEVEQGFWAQGLRYVAGLDEAGRGAWAGPVFAAAVVLPAGDEAVRQALAEVRDSKKLTPRRRELLLPLIAVHALTFAAGRASAAEVDALGIVPATRLAMRRALEALEVRPQALILDAITLPSLELPQRAFPRADARSLSVAAASIVAKVLRDRWMIERADRLYPGYGFARHKGYGTAQHREALARLGPSPIHRRTFRPVAERMREGD